MSRSLLKHGAYCFPGCVRAHRDFGTRPRMPKNSLLVASVRFRLVESLCHLVAPLQLLLRLRCGLVQWLHDFGGVRYESVIEIDHTQETAQPILRGRGWILGNRGNLPGQRLHPILRDGMAQEFNFCVPELAFARAYHQVVCGETAKELAKIFRVFLHGSAGDKHVIHVHE